MKRIRNLWIVSLLLLALLLPGCGGTAGQPDAETQAAREELAQWFGMGVRYDPVTGSTNADRMEPFLRFLEDTSVCFREYGGEAELALPEAFISPSGERSGDGREGHWYWRDDAGTAGPEEAARQLTELRLREWQARSEAGPYYTVLAFRVEPVVCAGRETVPELPENVWIYRPVAELDFTGRLNGLDKAGYEAMGLGAEDGFVREWQQGEPDVFLYILLRQDNVWRTQRLLPFAEEYVFPEEG